MGWNTASAWAPERTNPCVWEPACCGRRRSPSRKADAVQVLLALEEDLVACDGGGGVDFVVQDIGGEDLELLGVGDHLGGAPLSRRLFDPLLWREGESG